ncbi:phosphohydrolase [Clostridium acetobutylicum]|nr:phosphohydrolase [Clostridium acetobutylicum]
MLIWIVIIIVVTLLSLKLFIDNNIFQVVNYKLSSKKLPKEFDGFKIVQLADLHSKEFGEKNSNLIKRIKIINPNVIMVTGDMINDDENYDVCINLLKKLSLEYKVYFTVGNHEQNLQLINPHKYNNMMADLMKIKVDVIENGKREILYKNKKINLYGSIMQLRYYRNMMKKESKNIEFRLEDLEESVGKSDENAYNILMIHNPIFFNVYDLWKADLVLCGHMHGGMIKLPLIGGVFSPEHTFFPKYCSGRFQHNNTNMIVSRGLGRGGFGFRLFNRPELTVITLKNR